MIQDPKSNMNPEEAVTMAIKALQGVSAIAPATIRDEDLSDTDDEDAHSSAPQFVKKLKSLVDDPDVDSVVWSGDGASFVIHEPKRLSEQLIKYFKSSKLKSFVRQLHFYGFKKIGGSRYFDWVYSHKYFHAHGRLIHKLRRKTCGPDQQIKNLQSKVESLQGSLVDTQQKLGDMAVALMALLQHHHSHQQVGGGGGGAAAKLPLKAAAETEVLPAKRSRPTTTAMTPYSERGQPAVKPEARRLPANLAFSVFDAAAPMTPMDWNDVGFDDFMMSPAFGPDDPSIMSSIGVTA
eukprot:CAMPEP_0195521424 /NCGR_PEP_ID=MMETSP0794_2-20130614/18630_1 /TAXON_ID=515487 /ORGANISM="Stephanopyxis turris, Strain CCMP 815" /LENGTH=292 /DNA_ID=CAMNT_0040650975 /DNA_START=243 /DNA_END=1121 /DNA_ORIENTATION=+